MRCAFTYLCFLRSCANCEHLNGRAHWYVSLIILWTSMDAMDGWYLPSASSCTVVNGRSVERFRSDAFTGGSLRSALLRLSASNLLLPKSLSQAKPSVVVDVASRSIHGHTSRVCPQSDIFLTSRPCCIAYLFTTYIVGFRSEPCAVNHINAPFNA